MSKLISDIIDKECTIGVLFLHNVKGVIIDADDKWIKFKYTKKKKEYVEMIRISFITSISLS